MSAAAVVAAKPTATPVPSHNLSTSDAAPVASINLKSVAKSMETTSPALKSRKRSNSEQITREDVKKQRGRPRVEPKDETAADRRRTQIRLAQRTYRARKESTITSLEDKVTGLEQAFNQSRSNLRSIQRLAVEANLAVLVPEFFQQLSRLVDVPPPTFSREEQQGTEDDFNEDPSLEAGSLEARSGSDSDEGLHLHHQQQTGSNHQTTDSSALVPVTNQQGVQPRYAPLTSAPDMRGIPTTLGYEVMYEAPESSSHVSHNYNQPLYHQQYYASPTYGPIGQQQYSISSPHPQTPSFQQHPSQPPLFQQHPQHQSLTPFPMGYHNPSVPNELALPRGQAFVEDSFSRYFQRACLEWAASLIMKPDHRPDLIQRIFGHPLQYATLNQIRDRLQYRLSQPAGEDLDNPLFQGTGDAEPVDPEGYLRPTGVEQYLAMKGLKDINPRAQTMVCQIPNSTTPTQQQQQQQKRQQPQNATPSQPHFQGQGVTYPSVPSTPATTSSTPQSQQQHAHQHTLPTQQPHAQHLHQQIQQYHEYPVWPPYVQMNKGRKCMQINVQRFLNALIASSTCRGKTPAVTPEAVDKAIQSSIISVGPC